MVIKYTAVNIEKHVRVLASIFDFLNSHRFTLGISSCLIFGFFALSSLISFGQNSLQTGLVGWYPFDGNASDMSGNGNHGTVNGATLSTDRHGQTNKAYQFDGVDDFIDLNNPSILGTTNNFSILAWVNNGTGTIYGEFNAAAGNSRNNFKISGNHLGLDQYFPSGGAVSSLEILELNQTNSWNLVGYVRAGSNWSFFVHGQLLNSGSNAENYSGSTPNLGYIGARAYTYGGYSAGAKDFFTGSIDNVRIYNRALSNEEVSNLYRLESPNHFVELNSTVDLEMIHVETGTFRMGSPLTEAGRGTDETEHNVSLTKEFYLGKYEVTQAQYEAVMTGNSNGLNPNPSNWPNNPNRPVEKVSWDDIEIFLTRLNDAEYQAGRLPPGWSYTLPTEAQWEYACRAGTSSTYFWGYSINSTNTNYNQNIGQTQDVGEYAPNAWGFYDMHGNVFEWTADLYGSYDLNLVVDPVGPSNGVNRVFRGGSLNNSNYFSRSAKRQYQSQSYRSETKGFRLAYVKTNQSPGDLNSTASLTVLENQPVGSVVGEFNATDPDANATLTYQLVSGAGDGNNSLFTLDQNGTLKTAVTFDYETNASSYSIRVQARDEFNATTEGNFTINLLNNSWEDIAHSQRFSPSLLNGLQLWLDANHSSALTSSWSDLSGNNNHATRNADPVVVTNAQNGLSLMDYSGTNGQHHSFNRISDIRTVFWVLKYNAGYWVLLGDTTSYDFHSNGASGIFHSSFAHNGIKTGSSFAINGSAYNIDGAWPQSLSIISLRTSANVQASNFSNDRNIGGRFPNARLGELIVFNEALPDYEMDLVEGYLAHKWGLFSSLDYSHPFYGSVPTVNDYNSSHSSSGSYQADSIPNLSFWLDANDSSTFTLADSNVTQWRDKSGNGHVMDQIVGPGAPTRLVANGTGFVSFDGTTSIYTNTHLEDANYTIFTVSKQTGVTNARLIASKQSNWALGYFNGKYDSFYFNGWVRQGLNASNTQGHIHVVSANDADQVNCWVDFLHLVSDSNLAHDSAYKPGYLNLGGYGAVERSNGEVAEILYFNRVLDTEERVKIEGYLAHKWLLSNLLPINHYYKNNPPVFGLLEENATVTGSVQYQGVIPGPAYVWALDPNGTKVAEYILPDGNGSFSLCVPKGGGYDFKAFVDGSQNGYPTTGEVWKHYLDWNGTLGGFNLLQVDGNMSGINFSLWDQDADNDGFLKWHEHVAGTQDNNASSTPPLNFGLLAHWSFDETNGTVLHDSSGNDINGTLHGFSNPWSPGRVGGAFRFDGVDDYISFNGASQLDDIRPISFSGWIKLDQNGSGYVIAKRSLGTGYWRMFASAQSKSWLIRKSTGNVPSVTTTSPTSYFQWQHIVMTWNGLLGGTNSKIYLDGTLVGNVTRNSGSGDLVSDVGNLFTIGNRPQNDSSYFKGWMDDFRIWERVVTPNEVQQLFTGVPDENATISGVVTDSTTVTGSVIMWVFDENGNKVAEQTLLNEPGAYSFSLVRGHSYDIKAYRDGNGNGSLDPGIGESYAHWGAWNGNGFDLLPVDGNKTGIDISLTWEPDSDNDGFSLWQETQAGTSDHNSSSRPGPNFGLVAWYPFDGNASDMSGNGSHGTVNGVTLGADRFGQIGMAYDFDGVNDKIIVNGSWPNANSSRSVSAWYKAPSHKGNIFTFGDGLLQKARFSVGLNFNNIHGSLGFIGQGRDQMFSVNGLYHAWNMILLTYDGLLGNLYLNGDVLSESFNYILETNGSMPLIIGSNSLNRNDEFFSGCIDDVRIYNRALSAFEVQTLYQMEKPKEVLTNANFQPAVNLWFSDEVNATATYGHIRDWNVSGVTDMSTAFMGRTEFNEDVSRWDVSNVTNMRMMFRVAHSFNQPIGDWNTSSVTNMSSMFFEAKSFNQQIGNWDTSNVVNMNEMFRKAFDFNEPIGSWNVSSVIDMQHMFREARAFNQDIGSWDTSSVTKMQAMFYRAISFNHAIGSWDVSAVTTMDGMFQGSSVYANALSNSNKAAIHSAFQTNPNWPYDWGIYANTNPIDLNTTAPLAIAEGQLIGCIVSTFSVFDPDVNASILFTLVDGNGSDSNHEFSLDTNGTLRTAVVFDYEGENSDNDPTLHVRVRARDEYNASVERSFMVTILDVNDSQPDLPADHNGSVEANSSIPGNGLPPTVDPNESLESNSTFPITNKPIDGNDTAGDSNVTLPIIQVYRPIPETLGFVADGNNTYLIRGRILTDGGSSILESGVLVSEDILFRGEMIRLSSNKINKSTEFTVMVRNLTPGTTYYYRAFARNKMGETLGARKRLKTPEKIDLSMWFADMPKMGGGWRSSNWFGSFQQFPKVKWIYHSELGWAYILSDQKDGIWIWQNGRGWMWTQRGIWPYLFNHRNLGWLYLVKSINGNPFFYDFTIGNYSAAP